MKKFGAIYLGSQAGSAMSAWQKLDETERARREKAGIQAWMEWRTRHQAAIVDGGGPLGKTKRVSAAGIADTKNAMTGYVIVEAESHEAAAKMFADHPHFTTFPGEAVEIMECLPIPTR